MRNDGLIGSPRARLFQGPSPIKHVIYIIKENRTYDQVFGDVGSIGRRPRRGWGSLACDFWRGRRGEAHRWHCFRT